MRHFHRHICNSILISRIYWSMNKRRLQMYVFLWYKCIRLGFILTKIHQDIWNTILCILRRQKVKYSLTQYLNYSYMTKHFRIYAEEHWICFAVNVYLQLMIEANKEYFSLFPRSGRSCAQISSLTVQTTLLPINHSQGRRLNKD